MKILNKVINCLSPTAFFRVRDIFLLISDKLGVNEIFRIINKNCFNILFYHGISHRFIKFSKRHVSKIEFEKEIRYLIKKNYTFISLSHLASNFKRLKNSNQNYIILTFDDGFKNVIENAYPVMEKYNAKGSLYVVSDLIGKDKLLWTDYIELLIRNTINSKFNFVFNNEVIHYILNSEKQILSACDDIKYKLRSLSNYERLSHLEQFKIPNNISSFKYVPIEYIVSNWDELRMLDRNVLEIGCHTKTHPNLDNLITEQEFYEELMESKLDIERNMGYKVNHLCYPAGIYNNKVIQYVKKFDYLTATTTKEGFNAYKADLFRLKRLQMKNNFILFKAKISGLYFFMKKLVIKVI